MSSLRVAGVSVACVSLALATSAATGAGSEPKPTRTVGGSELGTSNRALVAAKGSKREPAIFFEGELLDSGPSSIWRINPNGKKLRLIHRAGRGAVVSENGKKIYFVRPKHRRSAIFAMRPDGSHRKELGGKAPATSFYSQDLSRRGRLAYLGDPNPFGDEGGEAIKLVNADGSGRRILYEIPADSLFNTLAVSANGRQVAFAELAGATSHIRVINSDGSGLRTIYTGAAGQMITGLAFSATGERIAASAFTQAHFGEITTPELLVMDADGTDLQMIHYPSPVENGARPVFSPGGKRLAFTGYEIVQPDAPRPTNFGEIFTIGVNGQGLNQITGPNRPDICLFCAGIDRASSWGRVVVK